MTGGENKDPRLPLSLRYRVTMDDLLAFVRQGSRPAVRKRVIYALASLVAFGIVISLTFDVTNGLLGRGLLLMVFAILPGLAVLLLVLRRGVVWQGDPSPLIGESLLTITEEGISFESPNCKSLLRWNGIIRLGESDKLFMIYISRDAAHIIPKGGIIQGDPAVVMKVVRERTAPGAAAAPPSVVSGQ